MDKAIVCDTQAIPKTRINLPKYRQILGFQYFTISYFHLFRLPRNNFLYFSRLLPII